VDGPPLRRQPAIGRAYLEGMEDAMRVDEGADFIVIFMLVIALSFIGNVLLDIAVWRSGILSKWAGAIWIAWAVMFYVAGVLSGFLFTSSSLPTQPIGSLLMAISGGWIVWSALRRPPPALQQQEA
jgi:ABC-type nickel/cobalt efflux system permease component RcnA